MRLFNFSLAITLFSAAAPVANALLGDIRIPPELIPEKCQPIVQLACKEGAFFDQWLKDHVCQDYKVSFSQVEPYMDKVVKKCLQYVWKKFEPPLALDNGVWSFYKWLKKECIMDPKWGIVNHPNLCDIKEDDQKFFNIVNTCIIPKVAAKYLINIPKSDERAKAHCHKGEDAVREILANTRCK